MIHIALQSEYSFQQSYYHLEQLVLDAVERGDSAVGIADTNNTFAHIKFQRFCEKHKIKPIFGVRLIATKEIEKARSFRKSCDQQISVILLAINARGLERIYETVKIAFDRFYYAPRLLYRDVLEISDDVIVIGSHQPSDSKLVAHRFDYLESNGAREYPVISPENRVEKPKVLIPYVKYSKPSDVDVFELFTHRKGTDTRTYGGPVKSDGLLLMDGANIGEINEAKKIADSIDNISIAKSDMIKFKEKVDFDRTCLKGAIRREVDLDDPIYKERYDLELKLIKEKSYVDYFLMVSDIINFAKSKMLVGPARGSSAGSLICYCLGITEIDPIPYGLLFNRFIDINRFDLPDIDTDFADNKRQLVIKYIEKKYGSDRVASIGIVSTMKPKSAIGEFASALDIPAYEVDDVKNSIIERQGGDARSKMCVEDTLSGTDAGLKLIEDHPNMLLTTKIEGHARHYGKHAAGVIVSNDPLTKYCGVDSRSGVIMMNKYDVDYSNILKIDILGLRTLSILEDTANFAGFDKNEFYNLPLDDSGAIEVLNEGRFSGIFQFEGQALQIVSKSMGIKEFSDIVAITALARPGALNSGGTAKYIKRHTGEELPVYYGAIHKEVTEETHGTVVYQEQMMMIARRIGNMTWAQVAELRRATSKSLGDEFFGKYKRIFIEGAAENGIDEKTADEIWRAISSSGSWMFNKSHAVSYALISYFTAWCKAHYPLEFAAANLNHAKDDESALRILRDFVVNDGIEYSTINPDESGINWSIVNGKLLGGLTLIHGIGVKKAQKIIKTRNEGGAYTPAIAKSLLSCETPFDILFPAEHYFGGIYKNPSSIGVFGEISKLEDCYDPGEYIIIGKVAKRDLRDRNDYQSVVKRGHKVDTDQFYLNLFIDDDTDSIKCTIPPFKFEELNGKYWSENAIPGKTWLIIKGEIRDNWRSISVSGINELDEKTGVVKC